MMESEKSKDSAARRKLHVLISRWAAHREREGLDIFEFRYIDHHNYLWLYSRRQQSLWCRAPLWTPVVAILYKVTALITQDLFAVALLLRHLYIS